MNCERPWRSVILIGFCISLSSNVFGQDDAGTNKGARPEEQIIGRFEKDARLTVKLAADSSQIAHPIAFSVDDFGRVFVAESFRYIDQKGGWTDIRYRMPWMDADLAARSVDDRRKLYESRLGDELADWKKASERVRLLEDPGPDGVYRKSHVFAEGFNDLMDGTIAGLLATREKVYVTNIPSLWELSGAARQKQKGRKALHTGFGVRLGYLGHDLHGLCWGPDGRLYFSLGDRGARIEKDGRTIVDLPDTGGVFRCEADGSNLELFAKGLRNPQELAFDAYGNLWTCDNNADRGDKARWVWVLPGGDSGWRIGYQHLNVPVALGAWTSEKIWHPPHQEQAGHLVPPVANLAQGPSGVAAHPGTGLPSRFTGQFLVCDYLGEGGGIYAVDVKRKGAGYEMLPPGRFLWRTPANDVDFATDGSVLFTTWTGGIAPESSGALYRVESPGLADDPLAQSTAAILKLDPSMVEIDTLGSWLEHPDMRVRRHAQFALVKRGKPAVEVLLHRISESFQPLSRITAMWGLAQLQRLHGIALPEDRKSWLTDPDPEVRATAARVIGESGPENHSAELIALLSDPDDRVKLWACLSLGKSLSKDTLNRLIRLAETHEDRDPWLRHGVASALARGATADQLTTLCGSASPAVRRVALVALRNLRHAAVADFLDDVSPLIIADAARAIYEERLTDALPKLAAFDPQKTTQPIWSEANRDALLRRWIHTNFRLGRSENADRLARFASDSRFTEPLRVEALQALADWPAVRPFDGVQGLYWPFDDPNRETTAARKAFRSVQESLLRKDTPKAIQLAALNFIAQIPADSDEKPLIALVESPDFDPETRSRALQVLVTTGASSAAGQVRKGLASPIEPLRLAAISSITRLPAADRLPIIRSILERGSISEKQRAIRMLDSTDAAAIDILSQLVANYVSGRIDPQLRLEVREAVLESGSGADSLRKSLDDHSKSQMHSDPLAKWRDAVAGGDPESGKAIFRNRTDLSCVRCHQPDSASDRVGPGLDDVGSRLTPEQLLQSIAMPNATLAQGFETTVVALKDGTVVSGLLQEEFPGRLILRTGEGKTLMVDKDAVEERTKGVSLMPEGLADRLSLRELRDLMAYLKSLTAPAAKK